MKSKRYRAGLPKTFIGTANAPTAALRRVQKNLCLTKREIHAKEGLNMQIVYKSLFNFHRGMGVNKTVWLKANGNDG